jgi:hypothetical protein
MATAVISLASSVVGGLLVLAGQWLKQRSDDRRYWRGLLRDAAADVVTSYSRERAKLTSDRERGKPTSKADQETQVANRQQSLNRLFTLPHGDAFAPHASRLGQCSTDLWQAYPGSDEEWLAARGRYLEAIQAFNTAVRQEMER